MKGLSAIIGDFPSEIKENIGKEIDTAKDIAKIHCKGKSGLSYDFCEAKLFIELNPNIIEGIVSGNWSGMLSKITG